MTRFANRDQRGIAAVVFAICTVLLFTIGALVVDLGNAQQRHRDVQTEADFAALAGAGVQGGNLPAPHQTPTASDPAVASVATYLLKNWTYSDQSSIPSLSQLEQNLTDSTGLAHADSNGQVYYGHFSASGTLVSNLNQLTVVTPQTRVNFGLANAVGVSHTDVTAVATVEIRSPSVDALPFYAATGCDYDGQTISQPSNGHSGSDLNLSHPSENNAASILAISPVKIAVNDTTTSLVISGAKFSGDSSGNVTQVGFFENGSATNPGPEPVVVPASGFTINSASKITVNAPLPSGVTSIQDVWYVRVMIANKWSDENNAPVFTVGTPLLTCSQGSSDGNFGTIQLSRLDTNGQTDPIAANIIGPLPHPLGIFPSAASPWTCSSASAGAILWPNDGTNCVDTKTGLPQDAATEGFVTGVTLTTNVHLNGRLTNVGPNTGCAANGTPATRTILSSPPYTINNDTLSCFLVDHTGAVHVGDIDSASYSLVGPALTPNIYNSPRFIWVPVFGTIPTSGGSNKYQILDFRPAFITDQLNSATYSTSATVNNGLTPTSNGKAIQSVQVVFLNPQAVPNPPPGRTTPYRGAGLKVVQLIN